MVFNNNKKKALEVANEIRRLSTLLNEILTLHAEELEDNDNSSDNSNGTHVRITNGTYKNKTGVIAGKRGSQFWWIRLDQDGEMIYKMAHNFMIIED